MEGKGQDTRLAWLDEKERERRHLALDLSPRRVSAVGQVEEPVSARGNWFLEARGLKTPC